jgi:hypothetical protein
MALHEVRAAKREEVILPWTTQVRKIVPEGMAPLELVNHSPGFVDEIASALRANAGLSPN